MENSKLSSAKDRRRIFLDTGVNEEVDTSRYLKTPGGENVTTGLVTEAVDEYTHERKILEEMIRGLANVAESFREFQSNFGNRVAQQVQVALREEQEKSQHPTIVKKTTRRSSPKPTKLSNFVKSDDEADDEAGIRESEKKYSKSSSRDQKKQSTSESDQVNSSDKEDINNMFRKILKNRPRKSKGFKDPNPSSSDSSSSDSERSSSSSSTEKRENNKKDPTRKNAKRRESVLLKEAEMADEMVRTDTAYIRMEPSRTHIRLEKLNIPAVVRFLDDLTVYQESNKIALKPGTLIKKSVIDSVLARNEMPLTSRSAVYAMTMKQILVLFQKTLKPRSANHFEAYLTRYLEYKVPHGYSPNVQNFSTMYFALLEYRIEFMKLYDFMSLNNRKNVPRCDNKEGGLIFIFLSKIEPFSFAKNMLKYLKFKHCKHIQDFLDMFFKGVQTVFATYMKCTDINQLFTRTAVPFPAHDKRLVPEEKLAGRPRLPEKRPPMRLNMIQLEDEDTPQQAEFDYDELPDLPSFYLNSDEDGILEETRNPMTPSENMHWEREVVEGTAQDDEEETDHIAALMGDKFPPSMQKPDVPNGCHSMIFKGECSKAPGKCSFSHDPRVLTNTHSYLSKLLAESKYKPTSTEFRPKSLSPPQKGFKPTILNRGMDRTQHVRPSNEGKINAVLDTAMGDVVTNIFLAAFPGGNLVKTVVKPGVLHSTEMDDLDVQSVLFDTGALHASYISKVFVDEHRQELAPHIYPCNSVSRLADGKTIVQISEMCILDLSVTDSLGKLHSESVQLSVLPDCCSDVIIGLPQIISQFGDLFRDMIDTAIKTFQKRASEMATLAVVDINTSFSHLPVSPPVWNSEDLTEAPEEADMTPPSSYPWQLHFMEMSYDEALLEYQAMIPSHVDPDFAKETNVLELLRTKGALVFVPQNWDGIKGIEPLEFNWKEGLPSRLKAVVRPINPRLFAYAKKEFDRLCQYMYEFSDSCVVSPLVIAPKPTDPFIRLCADYRIINGYISVGHFPIPIVRHQLSKISEFKIFIDLDMVNSFHQLRLGHKTKALLSIVTPWGQVQPKFLSEGVAPASLELQAVVQSIFKDFEAWTICIFDNFLILAHDYEDAYHKLEIFLDRCIERNLYLKFPKSWLGFKSVKFFGYLCKHNSYELTQERKEDIQKIAFPTTLKLMQSFLGEALFFNPFIASYSELTAPLHEMTHKSFPWKDKSLWTKDYESIFESFKRRLMDAVALHYPNYDWPWILRVDSSDYATGCVLLQKRPEDKVLLPITNRLGLGLGLGLG